ncbi:hypothetical protein GOD82_15005 [Sinorhizobium medicae]|uniref:hypothetical protein n=1 Tax=Sinorhizobium medicae TaxID=110321 RepID=UPI000372C001|nr:hypothetical protein [Sinorhizobium medicae]MDX0831230.1 hypothetical protein [Sinorhizobium medicae]RVI57147.1 hypothetical protein CN192_11620 [Sinorhizobium medicae]UFX00304.1 hypothetical protein SmedWSM1115_10810 [Sinorhizobium medicae WSM1115]
MNPVTLCKRLVAAGVTRQAIHKETGIGRRRIDETLAGATDKIAAQEFAKLEELAGRHLPSAALAAPFHERASPRYGR